MSTVSMGAGHELSSQASAGPMSRRALVRGVVDGCSSSRGSEDTKEEGWDMLSSCWRVSCPESGVDSARMTCVESPDRLHNVV